MNSSKRNIVIWIRDMSKVLRSRSLLREVAYIKQRLSRTVLWSWRSASRNNVTSLATKYCCTLISENLCDSLDYTCGPTPTPLLTHTPDLFLDILQYSCRFIPMVAYPAFVEFSVRNVSLLPKTIIHTS